MLALIEPVFGLIGAWGLFAAIAPKLRTEIWWMRVWVYGRLQTCLVLLAAAALYISLYPAAELGNASLLMAYAVAFLICAADIQPYLPGRKRELRRTKAGANGTPLSILLINVLQENEDHTAVISRIRDSHADVLFLSETNARWRDVLSDLEKDYPHTYLLDKEDHNGLLFYSRYPINQAQERYFCQDHVPSLTMDIDMAGSEVRLYCIHPRPPRPRDDTQHLDDELMIVADELREQERPALVIGDFNEVGWSWMVREFKQHAGLCDPKRGRGLYNSYGAKNPFLAWPLDHAFVTRDFDLVTIRRLRPCGSDHYPMLYGFQLRSV